MSEQRITWICDIHGTAGEHMLFLPSYFPCVYCSEISDLTPITSLKQKERYESDERD